MLNALKKKSTFAQCSNQIRRSHPPKKLQCLCYCLEWKPKTWPITQPIWKIWVNTHKSPILFPWLRSVKRPCWVWLYLWLCVIGLSVQLMVVMDSGGFNWVFCLGLGGCGLCGYGIGLRKSIGFLTSSVKRVKVHWVPYMA